MNPESRKEIRDQAVGKAHGRHPDEGTGPAPALRGNIDAYVLIGMVVLSIVFIALIPYQIAEPKLSFGRSFSQIKPSLFPTLAASGLLITSMLALLQSIQRGVTHPFKNITRKIAIQLVTVIAILWVFALIFEPVGYWISGILVSLLLSLYLGNRNILTLAILCLGVPTLIYYVFTHLLLISLPPGLLY